MFDSENYKNSTHLDKYRQNKLIIYALDLAFDFDDIHQVAEEGIADGPDDKKIDFLYTNIEHNYAIIAQSYYSEKNRQTALGNKASDLNTAVNWIFNRDNNDFRNDLKQKVKLLRNAIDDGKIRDLYIWYVHNCPESINVMEEMITVERTVHRFINNSNTTIRCEEIGQETIEKWFKSIGVNIVINDRLSFNCPNAISFSTPYWKTIVTYITAQRLRELYREYKYSLFSANFRDYLGSRKSDSNINKNIETTALKDPSQFWVYNNGITAITHKLEKNGAEIIANGFSIVNGAQTTGAIGSLANPPDLTCIVPIRFIECSNSDIIKNIILYNNTQNEITVTDMRSNDVVQDRLRKEFTKEYPDVNYAGGRRGGSKRPRNNIPATTLGQALTAFHYDPTLAYHFQSDIWTDNNNYSRIFNHHTTAKHIIFVFSLLRTIEDFRIEIKSEFFGKIDLTEDQNDRLSFVSSSGYKYLLIHTISSLLETILQKRIPSKFKISFKNNINFEKSKHLWRIVVDKLLNFSTYLIEPTQTALKDQSKVNSTIKHIKAIFNTVYPSIKNELEEFFESAIITE